ncbi:Arc family DNA-binding protein [Rhizobium sp. BK176]|uniref:Arc family DNA-binding protein n=1 Tax=Rhizobium sp. BK176 TaxID=2587071 RepID=UPI002168233F|nr:Arc family DNA-binding protein [Rhizobium sp. BK176]MCS4091859.1 hypothetical protein [Rhizobium sp. BK176]
MARAGRGSDQFPLRLPDGMRDRIKESAEAAGRSMNAEIVLRLESSFRSDKADPRRLDVRERGSEVNAEVLEHLGRLVQLLTPKED